MALSALDLSLFVITYISSCSFDRPVIWLLKICNIMHYVHGFKYINTVFVGKLFDGFTQPTSTPLEPRGYNDGLDRGDRSDRGVHAPAVEEDSVSYEWNSAFILLLLSSDCFLCLLPELALCDKGSFEAQCDISVWIISIELSSGNVRCLCNVGLQGVGLRSWPGFQGRPGDKVSETLSGLLSWGQAAIQ